MRKILCLFAFLVIATSVSAKSVITLKTGDLSVFGKPASAVVSFDYSKAEIEDKDISLDDFVEQKGVKYESKWERAQKMAHKDFVKKFNKKSEGLKLTAEPTEEAEYKMTISVRTINMGNTLKSFLPFGSHKDGGITMFGRIYIYDKTGKEICQLRFAGVQGLGSSGVEARLVFAYQELHSALRRYLNKSKESSTIDEEDDEEEQERNDD